MRHRNMLWPFAAACIATPALAQDRATSVDVPAAPLAQAVHTLSLQTGTSIGFHDSRLAAIVVRRARGRLTAVQALACMLKNTGLRARRVAPATYLVEAAPVVAVSAPVAGPPVAPAMAESEPRDIVVTGSKRDIPLGAYPGGVEIIDGRSLSAAAAGHGNALLETLLASVASTHLGPGRDKLFIRGIADSSFVGPTQATVGQYWGNSRITYSAPDPSLRLYDIERVEVLEGPQGTLYGAGSLGGVVRVVPRAPELSTLGGQIWGGVQAVQHGGVGGDGGAVLNVPVLPGRAAVRALVFASSDAGYIDDVQRGLKNTNRVRTLGGRLGVRIEPGDGWTVDVDGVGQAIHGDDAQYADRGGNGLTRASAIARPYHDRYGLAEVVARRRSGTLDVSASLSYSRQSVAEIFDALELADLARPTVTPGSDGTIAAVGQTNQIELISAEGRIVRHSGDGTGWIVGLSLLSNRASLNRQTYLGLGGAFASAPLTGVRNTAQEATVFGEKTVAPLRRVTVTIGGRLTTVRLSGRSLDAVDLVALRVDPGAGASRSETRFLPSAAIGYRIDDSATLFARYQQGFRPGGVGLREDFIEHFRGDRLGALEAGVRRHTRRLDASVGAAWTRWTSIQADLIDGLGFPTTSNIGDGRILSLGVATKWRPVDGLEFDGALYINDSRVTEFSPAALGLDGVTLHSSRLPNVADASGRIGLTYQHRLAGTTALQLSGFGRYIGHSTLGVGTILEKPQGCYWDTGTELRLGPPRHGISLAVTNLFDTRGNRFAFGSPFLLRDHDEITPLQPRSVRLGFDRVF
ncbi:TonB-dependent receptor domain-containing protein [Sphingomonas glacialis]|uniref:TonB-dependent receptor n=1 Tax=Sphingomonas glacialis TaxID=658225 RepID=A0A502FYW4_9SPHN|nr:TonB-dependent receptor [Sphingomonas glacialis]TPG54226.1 TonB-dependent receptor [Sphingomonas glacialis]